MKQRDPEWHEARAGNVTASRFKDVMTEPRTLEKKTDVVKSTDDKGWMVQSEYGDSSGPYKTKKEATEALTRLRARHRATEWSSTAKSYAYELLAEMAVGAPITNFETPAMTWGNEWEETAREEAKTLLAVAYDIIEPEHEYAHVLHPFEPGIGASPDGVIIHRKTGRKGVVEIKCPFNPANSVQVRVTGVMQYKPQIQGQIWVLEADYYLYVNYDPRLSGFQKLYTEMKDRDQAYIERFLAPRVCAFRDMVEQLRMEHLDAPF
jgi:hypothetical protein